MTEENEDMRKDLFAEYRDTLRITDSEHCLVESLYKMKKITDEMGRVSQQFGDQEMDVNTALLCFDVLLEATNEVRDRIREYI